MTSVQSGPIPFRHYLILFVLAAIWSSSFTAIKVAVVTVPPFTMTAARLVIAALILWVVLLVKGESLPKGAPIWVASFLIGFTGNSLPFTLIGWGEENISSGLASIMIAVMPLATVVLAHFFIAGERMTPMRVIGIGTGFCGILVLVGPEALKGFGGDLWRQLAVAGGAVSYAVSAILTRNSPPAPLLGRAVLVLICASVQMVPAAMIIDQPWMLNPTEEALSATVYLGVLPTAVASLIYFYIIAVRGAGFFSFINFLIPIMGVIWGAMFLGEEITAQAMIALGVILCGLFIANFQPKAKPCQPKAKT